MRVLAASPCGKTPVIAEFYDHFYALRLPEGSRVARVSNGSSSVTINLNAIFEEAAGYDYVFIVEDDSTFDSDIVMRLLKHDKDVVSGLCLSRTPPFHPYIYSGVDEISGALLWRELKPEDKGLIRVAATGMGGLLIKTEILKKLIKPYFIIYNDGIREWGQDILFNRQLITAGIEVYCDTDVIIRHHTNCSISGMRINEVWNTVVRVGDMNIKFPMVSEKS